MCFKMVEKKWICYSYHLFNEYMPSESTNVEGRSEDKVKVP